MTLVRGHRLRLQSAAIVWSVLLLACVVLQLDAQGGRGARGGAQGAPTQGFPAQQRPPGDATLISRGNTLYGIHCRSCHGADLRGGDQGGPNLLRSEVTMNDQSGELIQPVIREGRRNPGMPSMPAIDLSADDIRAIAEYIHSILATARGQGNPPPGPPVTLNVLVGDAGAGRTYFEAKCSSCHSATGDLRGIGSPFSKPITAPEFVGCGRSRWTWRRNHTHHCDCDVA